MYEFAGLFHVRLGRYRSTKVLWGMEPRLAFEIAAGRRSVALEAFQLLFANLKLLCDRAKP